MVALRSGLQAAPRCLTPLQPLPILWALRYRVNTSLYSHKVALTFNIKFVSTELSKDMPNHKSAEKRARQNEKRRVINRTNRGRLRTGVKKLRAAIESGDAGSVQTILPQTISLIDKAVQKGVLHRNAAARYKSRLTLHANEPAEQ